VYADINIGQHDRTSTSHGISWKLEKVLKPPPFATKPSIFNLKTSNDPIKVIPPAQMDVMPLVPEILTTYLLPRQGTWQRRQICPLNHNRHAILLFFSVALRPNAGHGLLILEVSRPHTTTHHSR
jgi:hypothetical protein